MTSNQALIEKTITTGNLNIAGALNPEQQSAFLKLVRSYSDFLPRVRFIRMSQPRMDIDKLHVGEPITRGIAENTAYTDIATPVHNKIALEVTKLYTAWSMSTETLQKNIEQSGYEMALMQMFAERMSTDFEMLAIQGDTSLSGTDPFDMLKKATDGWDTLTDSAHIVDVGGASVTKDVFKTLKQVMPKQYRADRGARFIMSDNLQTDWLDKVATPTVGSGGSEGGNPGGSALGDAALRGVGFAPFGVPIVTASLMPDDKTITTTSDQKAWVLGNRAGPFEFDQATDIVIDLGGSPTVTVTLTSGADVLDAVEVAQKINAALLASASHGAAFDNVARVDPEGRIFLIAPTTTETITLAEGTAESPTAGLTVLGLTAGATAPTAQTYGSGTFVWYCNPQQFIWAVLDGTRIYTEYNKSTDSIEVVIYNQVDAEVENLDAVVKASNVFVDSMGGL